MLKKKLKENVEKESEVVTSLKREIEELNICITKTHNFYQSETQSASDRLSVSPLQEHSTNTLQG